MAKDYVLERHKAKAADKARIAKLEAALTSARIQLVTLGGDPRPDGDATQCLVLDVIDAALSES